METKVGKEQVIKHLTQLRRSLAHSLKQPNISALRFNEIRAQLLPLDEQLRQLGVDPEPTPQMSASYIRQPRAERRRNTHNRKRDNGYEARAMQTIKRARDRKEHKNDID